MYETPRRQNKLIQLLQNLSLTVWATVWIVQTLMFSGLVGDLWKEIGAVEGPVDDVEGYALIAKGAAGIMGGFAAAIMVVLLIALTVLIVFFWAMFAAAYSKKASVSRSCIFTRIDAVVKLLLSGLCAAPAIRELLDTMSSKGTENASQIIAKYANAGTVICLLYLIGSIIVLINIHRIRSEIKMQN